MSKFSLNVLQRWVFPSVCRVREGVGVRVLKDGESIYHTEIRCEEDEFARLWALNPRDG